MVIRAAALGMTADEVAVGVLSLAGVRPAAVRDAVEVLLVECSQAELEFFARELEAHLPVRVDKVLLGGLARRVRRQKPAGHWGAAVTSFGHLPEVGHLLGGLGVPVIALLAEAHLETLHRLAQLRPGRGWAWPPAPSTTAHNLAHSIANAGLPNITLVGACPAGGRSGPPGATSGRHRLLQLGGRAGPDARGVRSAGDRRRPGPRPAGDRDARGHPGGPGRPQDDGGGSSRPEAPELSSIAGTAIAPAGHAQDGEGDVI